MKNSLSARAKGYVLIVSGGVLAAGLVASVYARPDVLFELQVAPLMVLALCCVPLTVFLNAASFVMAARMGSIGAKWRTAAEVSVIGTAANLLPLPGGVLTRVGTLHAMGMSVRESLNATAWIAVAWTAASAFCSGFGLALSGAPVCGSICVLAGCVAVLFAFTQIARISSVSVGMVVLSVQLLHVANASVRIWLCLESLGYSATATQVMSLTITTVAGSVVGVVPSGLGVREGAAAALSSLIDVPVALGFLSAAVNRFASLVTVTPVAVVLGVSTRRGTCEQHSQHEK
ncbi:MAG: hypothetical protein ACYTGL_23505 [Planctomycetota bacterium]|jgi:hypothetical protein